MLFDLTANTNSRKIMTLNPNFPKDVTTTVIRGNSTSATFTVEISEHGKPAEYTYQWYVDNTAVSGANNQSFTISNLNVTATKKIYCEVTNKKGTVTSRVATLNVTQLYTPALNSSYPENTSIPLGNSVTCKVAISTAGNPASYTYQWYKNGSKISGATGTSYTFTPTAKGTIAVFCKVTNTAGSVNSRTATITVTDVYLYNNGDECTYLTGGWVLESDYPSSYGAATMTKTNTGLNITCKNTGAMFGRLRTVKKIDLTGKKTLSMSVHISTPFVQHRIFATDKYANQVAGFTAEKNFSASASSDLTFTLDVSSLNGQYYVGLSVATSGAHPAASDITVKEVHIE